MALLEIKEWWVLSWVLRTSAVLSPALRPRNRRWGAPPSQPQVPTHKLARGGAPRGEGRGWGVVARRRGLGSPSGTRERPPREPSGPTGAPPAPSCAGTRGGADPTRRAPEPTRPGGTPPRGAGGGGRRRRGARGARAARLQPGPARRQRPRRRRRRRRTPRVCAPCCGPRRRAGRVRPRRHGAHVCDTGDGASTPRVLLGDRGARPGAGTRGSRR